MGVEGYNKPGSSTFHTEQRCSGAVFSFADAIDSQVAENRGCNPCRVNDCCGGEWPHEEENDGAD